MGRWSQRIAPNDSYRYKQSQEIDTKGFKRWQIRALIDLVRDKVLSGGVWFEFSYCWPSPSGDDKLLLTVGR